jgi:hypothetical protein
MINMTQGLVEYQLLILFTGSNWLAISQLLVGYTFTTYLAFVYR